jgi:integrase
MTGSLQHLGGDRYRVRVYVGPDPLNASKQRTVSKSFRAKNEREAKRAMSRHITEIQDRVKADEGGKGTIAELVSLWERDRSDFSPSTKQRNESILRTIRADLGKLNARNLTTLQVDQWFALLRSRGLSPSTVHQYGRVLSTMLKDGKRWNKVSTNVVDDARKPKVPKPDIDPPTTGELRVLLASAKGDLGGAIEVLARTGCRRGEVVGLRWSDIKSGEITVKRVIIELKGGGLHVRDMTKGRKPRTLPIDPPLLDVLERQRDRQEAWFTARQAKAPRDCFIFANLKRDPTGETPRRPGWLSLGFARLCKKLDIDTHPHALRHWNASTLIAMGVPVTTVSARLGHAQTSTTTNIYGHGTDAGSALAVAAIGAALPVEE